MLEIYWGNCFSIRISVKPLDQVWDKNIENFERFAAEKYKETLESKGLHFVLDSKVTIVFDVYQEIHLPRGGGINVLVDRCQETIEVI